MVSVPGGNDCVVQVATPLFPTCITGTGLGHSGIGWPLLVKVTLPVGSWSSAVTVAVNVTGWFTTDGLREEVSCVVVVMELVANSIQRTPFCPFEAVTSKFTYQCCFGTGAALQFENRAEAIWVLQSND